MVKKDAEMNKIRKELLAVENVSVVAIVNKEGGILISYAPVFAQTMAELVNWTKEIIKDIRAKKLNEMILVTESERIIVMMAGPDALVAIRAELEANQQLISLSILRAAKAVEELTKQEG